MSNTLLEPQGKTPRSVACDETARAPFPEDSPAPEPSIRWQRWDVVRYRYNGHTHSGTVICSDGNRVWVKTGSSTLAISNRDIVSLTQPSSAR